ncbi:MAG: EutN/CcmL family microcompartment protein [Ruthenibacterium sp.]
MIVGKVMGSVVSTRKSERLLGSKLMIVQPVAQMSRDNAQLVAVDNVGAGVGELVLVAFGSAARIGCDKETAPIDAAIVGIVDNDCNSFR